MSDSPEQFVLDVIDADKGYAHAINLDTFLGNFRVELFGLKQEVARAIGAPIVNPALEAAKGIIDERIDELKAAVRKPPKCFEDEVLYQGMQYMAKVEAPYAMNFIDKTFLRDEVEIPAGTQEYLDKLAAIPKCE